MMYLNESAASEKAHSLGLTYYGFGRWGKDGLCTHETTKDKTLVPFVRKHPKHKVEGTKEDKNKHPSVYEDDDLMYHKTAVEQKEFSKKLPTKNVDAACLYLQVLHSLAIQTGTSVHDMMKKYNPTGDDLYGISLPKIIAGFKRVEVNGEKLDPKVHALNDLDEAVKTVREGTPVLCMVKTYGSLMMSMSKKSKESMKKVRETGDLDVIAKSNAGKEGLYHVLMLVGVDKKENKVIFRDSEKDYAKNGFLKVDMDYFKKKNPEEILKFITITP